MLEFLGYFLIGGSVVALTTFYGSRGHGALAAFIGLFPAATILTFLLIYRTGGNLAVVGYAKNLVFLVFPWVLYVFAVAFLCERLGIWWSLAIGVGAYVGVSWAMMHFRP